MTNAAEKEGGIHIVHLGGDKYMATWTDYAVPGARAGKPRMCNGRAGVDDFLKAMDVNADERKRVESALSASNVVTIPRVRLTEKQLKKLGLV